MQFGQPFDTLYQEVIFPQANALGLNVLRMDELAGPGIIFEDIKRQITEAKIVIAEITAPHQNVFYELGYACAQQANDPSGSAWQGIALRYSQLPRDLL